MLQLRNLYDFSRKRNSEFIDNIGKAYMSLKELKPRKIIVFSFSGRRYSFFLRILPRCRPYLHDALATVVSKEYLLNDYETTIKLLKQLIFHATNITKTAGYKALKIGLVILVRVVDIDATGNVVLPYYGRLELMFNFITTNV